ncbi:MAG: phosphatidate cytidylyltransferase [Bacteroidales bacterium]|nr:phosphatidate cytidylyltransferase [Bacteroidales bacterium]
MKKLLVRTLTGICFVAVVVLSVLFGDKVILGGTSLISNVFLIFTCIALYEYRSALRETVDLGVLFWVVAVGIYVVLSCFFPLGGLEIGNWFCLLFLLSAFCLLLLLPLAALFQRQQMMESVAWMFYGIFWIVVPFSMLNIYYNEFRFDVGKYLLLAFFILVWANDTFAYCAGSLIGKHPFFERISPKKTWEGTVGGGLLTLVAACFFPLIFPSISMNRLEWIVFALLIVLFGTLGDLVESMFKRHTGVKDSGGILPGHGGVLDRFDSTLMALPFVTLYLLIIYKP